MNFKIQKELLPIFLISLAFVVGAVLYPSLPEKIPTHWNAQGEIDVWSSKNFGVFFFPGLAAGVYLLMLFIPLIDPFRKNYDKFIIPYFWFRVFFISFFILIYFYTLWVALGGILNIIRFILPVLSIFFILIGIFLPKLKRNYFVGIRTPWTLHSEEVWDKTHKFGGKVFMIAGFIALASILIPKYAFQFFIAVILLTVLVSASYSYLIFRKMK